MIILDTCVLVFDALSPEKLTKKAMDAINQGEKQSLLHCCDISLWEIAMLIDKKRLHPGIDTQTFIQLILTSRSITVLEINAAIAAMSASSHFTHQDPADRLIASTAQYYQSSLVTCDQHLSQLSHLDIIW